ncbi:hypothetical protein NE236_41615 [Actinoallomurus purpureus]|uniref:hypothetical protein n=1 Tax=Actinoallomurus purpureus TaxID=478114 RepID=UPI002093FA4A|nr:hypothetical protein [Actinoallomurus purpureus]MCO6011468.1 hypothetical protein [Actinoallomurus purpureus]
MIDFEQQPDGTQDTTRVAEWHVICNVCRRKRPASKASRWLFPLPPCDANYCERCERRIARQLITQAGRSDPVAWLVGWVRSWRGRRADRAYTEDPFV